MKNRRLKLFAGILVMVMSLFPLSALADGRPQDNKDWYESLIIGAEEHNIMLLSTSTLTVEGSDVLWTKDEYMGTRTWYGIDDPKGQLSPGTRVIVKQIHKEDGEAYSQCEDRMDQPLLFGVSKNSNILCLLLQDENGENVSLQGPLNFYVEIPDSWDTEDVQAYYISDEHDEQILKSMEIITGPEGKDTFCKLELTHLGEPIYIGEKASFTASVWSNYQPVLTIVLLAAVIFALIFIVKKRSGNK